MRISIFIGAGLIAAAFLPGACGQDDSPDTRVFDTGHSLTEPLTTQAVAQHTGWKQVPEDNVKHAFTGDAVVLNDKVALVFRKQSAGVEQYGRAPSGLKQSALISRAQARFAKAEPLTDFKLTENTSGGVRVEAMFTGRDSARVSFRLTTGEPIVEIRSAEQPVLALVQSDSRYVVVPDYFGDDLVYSATNSSFRGLLPAENFCLQLLEKGDAMLMSVWQSRDEDAAVTLTNESAPALPCSTWLRCSKDQTVWLALLEAPDVWHAVPNPPQESWQPPFSAKWRFSYVRANCVADSWDSERGSTAEQRAGPHQGPLLTYLMDRTLETPLTAVCPTDIMRNTLGVGPCQYILACEGLGSQGDPTPNSVMGWVEKQFEAKKQRRVASDIKERLKQMTTHVADARSRIQRYASLAAHLESTLANRTEAKPFLTLVAELQQFAAAGLGSDSAPQRADELALGVVALTAKDDATSDCRRLGEALRALGAIQDRSLAKCRMTARRLRQEARTLGVRPEAGAHSAEMVRRAAEQMLQSK